MAVQDKHANDFSLDPGEVRRYQIRALTAPDPDNAALAMRTYRRRNRRQQMAGARDATTAVATAPSRRAG